MIEKYAGAFPTWLAPVQVKVLPISDKYVEYASQIQQKLFDAGIRAEIDDRAEKIGYKIREAQLQKIPFMLIAGEKEQAESTVSVRARRDGDVGSMKLDEFLNMIQKRIETKELD